MCPIFFGGFLLEKRQLPNWLVHVALLVDNFVEVDLHLVKMFKREQALHSSFSHIDFCDFFLVQVLVDSLHPNMEQWGVRKDTGDCLDGNGSYSPFNCKTFAKISPMRERRSNLSIAVFHRRFMFSLLVGSSVYA